MAKHKLSDQSHPDISLVMPGYHEQAIVAYTIAKLTNAFGKAGYGLELITVNNGSDDRTGEILKKLARLLWPELNSIDINATPKFYPERFSR